MALNVMYVTKKQEVLVAVIDRNDSLTCWNNSGCDRELISSINLASSKHPI